MRDDLLHNNLFLHGEFREKFESQFVIDLSFTSDYDYSYRQAMRSRRHSIWKALRRSGLQVGTDSSQIVLTPVQRAETMIRKIRHSYTNYDRLWKTIWLHHESAALIHGDYRVAAVTKIVEIFPQLLVGYELIIDQCVAEQLKVYESMSRVLDEERIFTNQKD